MTRRKPASICILFTLWALDVQAQEQAVTDRVIVPHGSGEYELRLHPATVAVLYFPDPVQAVSISSRETLLVRAQGSAVSIRPRPGVAPGPQASLRVVTATMRVSFLLHVVDNIEHATLQRTFLPKRTRTTNRESLHRRVSVQLGGAAGRAWTHDSASNAPAASISFGALTGRIGYRGSRYHAYEAAIHAGQSTLLHGDRYAVGALMAQPTHAVTLIRAELGASVRLPFWLTPVMRVAAGVQHRSLIARVIVSDGQVFDGPGPVASIDLTARTSVGVEYQITPAWSVAVDIGALVAWPPDRDGQFTSLEGGFHVHWH